MSYHQSRLLGHQSPPVRPSIFSGNVLARQRIKQTSQTFQQTPKKQHHYVNIQVTKPFNRGGYGDRVHLGMKEIVWCFYRATEVAKAGNVVGYLKKNVQDFDTRDHHSLIFAHNYWSFGCYNSCPWTLTIWLKLLKPKPWYSPNHKNTSLN